MVQRSPDLLDIAEQGLERALEAERRIEPGGNVRASWEALFEEARGCTRCDLYKYATQTVFGEGPLDAKIVFVGEQPGDQEDLAGRPFVGPAGRIFDAALQKAGIDRAEVYVTNAVKHFDHERALIKPPVTVALGATAARSLVGKVVTIGKVRGEPLTLPDGSECWVTVHPSSILRAPDEEARREGKRLFLRDLKLIKARAEKLG
jgi:DNA polymerase